MIHKFNSSFFATRVQRTLALIAGLFNLDLNLKNARNVKITIETRDGQGMYCQVDSDDGCARSTPDFAPAVPVTWTPGALTAGVKSDFSVSNAAGDRLVARLVTPGGNPADYYVATRVDNSNVAVTAYKRTSPGAAAVVETGDTSTVEVANLKQLFRRPKTMKLLKSQGVSVTTSAAAACAASDVQADTKSVVVQANPSNTAVIYIVNASSVAKTEGIIVAAGASVTLDVADPSALFLISDSGTQNARIAQLG